MEYFVVYHLSTYEYAYRPGMPEYSVNVETIHRLE